MKWIEIPAHRVLEIGVEEKNLFELLNCKGEALKEGEMVYRIVRNADNKVFTLSEIQSNNAFVLGIFWLKEL